MARIPNLLLPVKAQMSMCLGNIAYGDKMKTATAKSGGIKQNIEEVQISEVPLYTLNCIHMYMYLCSP